MTNSIVINNRKNAIEITKVFNKKASIFGSDEYKLLKEAKADFPAYRVVVKAASKKTFENRITMNDIIRYVAKTNGEDSEQMKTLQELRGKSVKEAGDIFEIEATANFMEIKEWFFLTYPDLAEKTKKRQKRIDEILTQAAKNNEAA